MKRMSPALEVRRLVGRILDTDPDARVVVAGDFNATPDEVPVLAIRGAVEDTGNGTSRTSRAAGSVRRPRGAVHPIFRLNQDRGADWRPGGRQRRAG
jgi:endonuclease/exonuclease/phosphatase family metal-dependent hydrolase